MKGLIAAIVLAFMAATVAPAIAEVAGGTIQLAQAGKKGKKKATAHKPAKKPARKAHKPAKKGKKKA